MDTSDHLVPSWMYKLAREFPYLGSIPTDDDADGLSASGGCHVLTSNQHVLNDENVISCDDPCVDADSSLAICSSTDPASEGCLYAGLEFVIDGETAVVQRFIHKTKRWRVRVGNKIRKFTSHDLQDTDITSSDESTSSDENEYSTEST